MFIALLIIVFLLLYIREKRNFFNALFFSVIVYMLGSGLFVYIILKLTTITTDNIIVSEGVLKNIVFIIPVVIAIILIAIIPLTIFILTIATFFNSKVLMAREGKRFGNLFIALIGCAVVGMVLWFMVLIFSGAIANSTAVLIFVGAVFVFSYFMFIFSALILYATLYHFTPVFYKPNYIIVLGSGLIGDKVPPLLASRLDKAVERYYKYKEVPYFVVSGGQGSDELVAEAVAMKKYLMETHHIAEDKILVEDASVDTEQNMRFSKEIMTAHFGSEKFSAIFVTNSFHVYRASLYAKKAGLKAEGVGAKTAFYYVPNAFTREFIGILEMYKWYHLTVVGIIVMFTLLLIGAYM